MQLPSYTPAAGSSGVQQAAESGHVEVVRTITDALAWDEAIVGYYSHLATTLPQYAEPHAPVVAGSPGHHAIREQLIALATKAASLLRDAGKGACKGACKDACDDADSAGRLRLGLMQRLARDTLEDHERDYFYSRTFKETFEEKVARADLARPEDGGKARRELHVICYLLGDPSSFVLYTAATGVLQDFSGCAPYLARVMPSSARPVFPG
ncbi:hypothetical protein CAL26_06420 [Bordetella genomosp. 9]|uniref:Uncharacterized protein n=1 Tax=Bordetella genomosp. 9 TaxID=1416803 RepID=A0A261RDV1_9BORD|nr:hypothetical protein [Bordetella genomosp. 9]OZI23111.1 hypothetical protein CAL26_06420 [Bordetella genomosp. 9]